jgi:phosphatidate cytidylyltransferase
VLKHRLIFGTLLVVALLLFLWADAALDHVAVPSALREVFGGRTTLPPGLVILPTCMVLSIMGARELARMFREKGIPASGYVTCAAALSGMLISAFVPATWGGVRAASLQSTIGALLLAGALLYYARHRSVTGALALAGVTMLAYVYLGLMFGFVMNIRREQSVWVFLWVLLTTKSSDIGAYFTGRALGRRKLIPWLSPGKTWEGLWGGVVLASLVGALGAWALRGAGDGGPGPVWGGLGGAIFALLGQAGDLAASLFKRDAGRKDAGHSLPGFGGVLDVIDSPLLVLPAAYWLLVLASE